MGICQIKEDLHFPFVFFLLCLFFFLFSFLFLSFVFPFSPFKLATSLGKNNKCMTYKYHKLLVKALEFMYQWLTWANCQRELVAIITFSTHVVLILYCYTLLKTCGHNWHFLLLFWIYTFRHCWSSYLAVVLLTSAFIFYVSFHTSPIIDHNSLFQSQLHIMYYQITTSLKAQGSKHHTNKNKNHSILC